MGFGRRDGQTHRTRWPWIISMLCLGLVGPLASPVQGQGDETYLRSLAGSWQIVGLDAEGNVGEDPATRSVFLPTDWQTLEETAKSPRFRLTYAVQLPPGDPLNRSASGLAVALGMGGLCSCRVEVDGRGQGRLGSPASPLPLDRTRVVPLEPPPGSLNRFLLALECERPSHLPAHFGQSMPFGAIDLGDRSVLEQEADRQMLDASQQRFPWLLLPVFLLAVGAYHLRLFGRRQASLSATLRSDSAPPLSPAVKANLSRTGTYLAALARGPLEYLWFGLLAVDLSLVVFFDRWAAELPLEPAYSGRILEACGHGLLVLLPRFLLTFLARPMPRWLRFYEASHLLWALWVLAMPGYIWVLRSETLRRLWGLPGWIYLALLLILAIRKGKGEARLVSLGGLAVVISGLCAWLFHLFGVASGYGLLPWSFVLFTLAMAMALERRFWRAHQEIDRLRLQLEEMVEDRTQELSAANDQLKAEIAERQLAEEAMRMLERSVEQSIDGVLVVDLEGRAQFVNEAWAHMHDCEVFEVLGRTLLAFHTPEQLEKEIEPCLENVLQGGAFEGEVGHLRKGGETFPAWTSLTLLRDGDEQPVGFVAVGRDASAARRAEKERNQLEQKIQHSRKLESLGKLASGLAHDYNNLLTGVLGNVSLLRSTWTPGPLLDKLSQVEAAAERAVDLTLQLRSYAGEDHLLLAAVDTNDLTRRMEGELMRVVGGSARLDFELSEGLPSALLDASQMRHLLRNLVSNAAEATAQGGSRIVVRTSLEVADRETFLATVFDIEQPAEQYLCLEVEDDGSGISEEVQTKMFDPFFTTRPSARGLGLAMALGIVRAHGGTIRVRSAPGQGTTLTVLLPLTAAVAEKGAAAQDASWRGSGTVLVVDDQELMREVSSSILETQGFEVLTASTGDEAVRLFEEESQSIRLVLLDRTMPGMDGEEVLAHIRRIDPSTVVVLMSGYKEKDALRGLDPDHLSGFLAKPFRPADLLRELKQALGAAESES